MKSRIILLIAAWIGITGICSAGVPIDTFNSANAGLNPALAVDREARSRTGAADALLKLAQMREMTVADRAFTESTAQSTTESRSDSR